SWRACHARSTSAPIALWSSSSPSSRASSRVISGGMDGKRRCRPGRHETVRPPAGGDPPPAATWPPSAPLCSPPVPPIRVLVCDDVEAYRALMRYTLPEDPGIEVVGEAANGEAAIERAGELQPDVVLLDLTMPLLDGIDAIPRVLARAPRARVVALSG